MQNHPAGAVERCRALQSALFEQGQWALKLYVRLEEKKQATVGSIRMSLSTSPNAAQ